MLWIQFQRSRFLGATLVLFCDWFLSKTFKKTDNSRTSSSNDLDTIQETEDDWKESERLTSSPNPKEVSYEEIDNLLDMSRGIIDSMTGIDAIETNDSGLGLVSQNIGS